MSAVRFAVRDSTDADLPAIQRIYAHHVLNGLASFEEEAPDLAELAKRRREIVAKGLPHLVAGMTDGVVLGYAYAAPFRMRSAYRFTVEDSVYVAPDAARHGIGRALLAALLPRCAELGYRQMVAVIGDSANDPSIGLHRALGFARVALLPSIGFKFGRWIDCVMMQRGLGAGDTNLP